MPRLDQAMDLLTLRNSLTADTDVAHAIKTNAVY